MCLLDYLVCITLPENSTAISVWFRVTADCETQFGTDYMALEDLTPTK